MDKKNKNFLLYLLFAMTAMVLVIISSYLAIAELSDFKNAKDTLTIIISIIALFTTFGGAYLGAKISGENTKKIEIERQRVQNLTTSMSLVKDIKSIIDEFDENIFKIAPNYSTKGLKKNNLFGKATKHDNLNEQQVKNLNNYLKENGENIVKQINNLTQYEKAYYIMTFNENLLLTIRTYCVTLEYLLRYYESLKDDNYSEKVINEKMAFQFEEFLKSMQYLYNDVDLLIDYTNVNLLKKENLKQLHKNLKVISEKAINNKGIN